MPPLTWSTRADETNLADLTVRLDQEHPDISLLINNAGVIHPGQFCSADPSALHSQILLDAPSSSSAPSPKQRPGD